MLRKKRVNICSYVCKYYVGIYNLIIMNYDVPNTFSRKTCNINVILKYYKNNKKLNSKGWDASIFCSARYSTYKKVAFLNCKLLLL